MKTDENTLLMIQKFYDKYKILIESSNMKPLSMDIYITHAHYFVRWLADDFTPGARLRITDKTKENE